MANDLYNLISNKMNDINTISSGLAEKQKAAPTIEARLREATMGNDAGLNDLRQQYSNGVLELFKYDQEKSKSYLSPEMQAAGMVADPMVGENFTQSKFMNTAKTNQATWQELDKRKTVLGDLVKASMDKYNAELEGDKTLIAAADKQLTQALNLLTEQRLREKQNIETGASGDLPADIAESVQMIADGTGSIKDVPIAKRAKVSAALKKSGISGVNLIASSDRKPVALALELNQSAADAEKILKPEYTGPVDQLKGNVSAFFNKADDNFIRFNQVSAGIKTAIQNAIAGANLTKNEITELQDFVIRPMDSDQKVKQKIQGLQAWSKRKGQSLLTTGSYSMNFDDLVKDFKSENGSQSGEVWE